jgi:hypothetical protein
VDHFTDAAGSSDTDDRQFYLCQTCLCGELNVFLDRLTIPQAQEWVAKITKMPFRDRFGKIHIGESK